MSFWTLFWTLTILMCVPIFALADFANKQMLLQFPNNFAAQRLWENFDQWKRNTQQQRRAINSLTTKNWDQTRKVAAIMTPQSRRFLFSPTIQNTITNLNHNSNVQDVRSSERNDQWPSHPYVNPRTGTMEYDVRSSRPRKICITFE